MIKRIFLISCILVGILLPITSLAKQADWPPVMKQYHLHTDKDGNEYFLETQLGMQMKSTKEGGYWECFITVRYSSKGLAKVIAQRKSEGKSVVGWTKFECTYWDRFRFVRIEDYICHSIKVMEFRDVKTQKVLDTVWPKEKWTTIENYDEYGFVATYSLKWMDKYLH